MNKIIKSLAFLCLFSSFAFLPACSSYSSEKVQYQQTFSNLDEIDGDVSAMLGQMIICGFKGQNIEEDPAMSKALKEGKIGGVILFYRHKDIVDYNIASVEQVVDLIDDINSLSPYPLFISIDQEGGMVQRISSKNGFEDYPSAYVLGKQDVEKTKYSADKLGKRLHALGFNLNFAPVVDVHNSKSLGIGKYERAFHEDVNVIAEYALVFSTSMKENSIIPTLKHFPGHGNATNDTHDGFTDITNTWNENELLPYKKIFAQAYDGMVMTAHVYNANFDNKPATLSYNIITKLLREELGFEGLVTTDDMQMKAISNSYSLEETLLLAINAGVDIMLFGNNLEYDPNLVLKLHSTMLKLYEDGEISKERIEESWFRIKEMKLKYLIES